MYEIFQSFPRLPFIRRSRNFGRFVKRFFMLASRKRQKFVTKFLMKVLLLILHANQIKFVVIFLVLRFSFNRLTENDEKQLARKFYYRPIVKPSLRE